MRIALLAPLALPVPPPQYGGIETVVGELADGLVDLGHDVTLFATANSHTRARLVPVWPRGLSETDDIDDWIGAYTHTNAIACGLVAEMAGEFDVIHSHIHENALVLSKCCSAPLVSTIHREVDTEFQHAAFRHYDGVHLVSVSDRQRHCFPTLHWCSTVYNGVDVERIPFQPAPQDDYLLFLGRISPLKDPVSAIEIARATGKRLIIAAKLTDDNLEYFTASVAPLLREYPDADFIGEVDFATKVALYQNARALLFPITWEEPFGLVMAESLAAGTPVIARRRGAVPEIVEDGISGFMGQSNSDLAAAVLRLDEIDRRDCRARAERFSSLAMVRNYANLYQRIAEGGCRWRASHSGTHSAAD